MKLKLQLVLIFCISLFGVQLSASHLMGGNITYECVGNNTYIVKVELYRDCNGITLPNSVLVEANSTSCGISQTISIPMISTSPEVVTQICSAAPDACNDPTGIYGVQKYTYIDSSVTLSSCNDWTLSWTTCCRNAIITTGAANESFFIYATLDNTLAPCNSSPSFDFDPIFYACIGDTAVYSHGVSDLDGDNLNFSLIPCYDDDITTQVNYNTGFSGLNPLSNSYINVDPTTGTIKFVPTIQEVGVICMLVEEFRNGIKIGETIRDIQIGTTNCLGNATPVLSGFNGTANASGTTGNSFINITSGQSTCFTIDAYDGNSNQILDIQYTNSLPGATYSVNSTTSPAQITICWTPTLNHVGSHTFGISIEDNACPITAKKNYTFIVNVQQGPSTIQGTITRSDSLPLSFSKVYLYTGFSGIADSTTTDSSGYYSIVTTSSTNVKLQAVPSLIHFDQQPTFYQNATSYINGTSISVAIPSPIAIDFSTLPNPVTINGTVTRHDGQALDNSWIHLIDTSMNTIDSVQSSSQGVYSFNISDYTIDYYIKAVPGGNHADQVITYYNSSETIQAADSIPILATNNIANFSTIDTANATGGKSIGGIVGLGSDNFTPYPDVRLILISTNGEFINDAITGDNGEFMFYGLADGSYKIFVDRFGIDNTLAPVVTLTPNQTSRDSLELLLHSYYLEMLNPNTTISTFKAKNITVYPNPIHTTFTIEYDLSAFANVQIDILDVNGKVISTVLNENQGAGEHNLRIVESTQWSNGIYFIRMMIDGESTVQKIIKQ